MGSLPVPVSPTIADLAAFRAVPTTTFVTQMDTEIRRIHRLFITHRPLRKAQVFSILHVLG